MNIDWVRQYCLSLPHSTEKVQWEDNLVFKVGGKMYAVVALEPGDHWLSFKCTLEEFAELVERPGIVPAPYLARAHWVSLQDPGALAQAEVKRLLREAYELVVAKLPKKTRAALDQSVAATAPSAKKQPPHPRPS
jgi:predicted DNA-binding protein (MmcQ/YjbR family)